MTKFEEIKEIVEKIQKTDFTDVELLSYGRHYENRHSTVIRDFLRVKTDKGYIFLEAFIDTCLKNTCLKKYLTDKTPKITTEYPTSVKIEGETWKGRIDIFVEIDDDTCIIIENKIYANDQQYQLQRYIEGISEKFNDVYVVYLTLDGSYPTTDNDNSKYYSIEKNKLDELENNKKFFKISYEDDILAWLEKCSESKDIGKYNLLLWSALVQYKESVEILTNIHAEKIHEIILGASKDELSDMLKEWVSLGDFEYKDLYRGLLRTLYLHEYLNESHEGKWEFASRNLAELTHENVEKDKLRYLPHMCLYNTKIGIVLMIFKDYSEQIQLHYINKDLEDCGHPEPLQEWQKYFKDWGKGYETRFIEEIDKIEEDWINPIVKQKNSSS